MSIKEGRTVLRVRRDRSAGAGILLALLLSCQLTWARVPQASQGPETKQTSQPQEAPQTLPARQEDLTKVNIEDLMNIEVSSVSKKEQKLSRVAAAVFVITPEDIRRSGATNIPDLLRMVPGLQVAQINGSTWAITARGFDGQYSNKLLVLVDGRTVYSPIFSGTYWDTQSLLLENIERIEVIRGPGATVWGANAVNGVINITTKKAADTQGGLVNGGGGTSGQGFGAARYGGTIGDETSYRVSGGGFNFGHNLNSAGQSGEDDWRTLQAGFRLDVAATPKDSLTVEGDAYRGDAGELVNTVVSISPPANGILTLRDLYSGWDLISRWNHVASPNSETSLQVNFDRNTRGDGTYGTGLNTFGIDFEQHVGWGKRQDFVWGLGGRFISSGSATTLRTAFTSPDQTEQIFSSFVQDEIAMQPDRLYLTLGVKVEHNGYTGFGWEPSARIAWNANQRNMLWAAVSRALRTPAQTDQNVRVNFTVMPGPDGLPLLVAIFGTPNGKDEREDSFEVGYRTEILNRISVDATAFYNNYGNLVSLEPGTPILETDPPPVRLVIPRYFKNLLNGETSGLELSLNWKVASRWTLSPGYSFLEMHLHRDATSEDLTTIPATQGAFPSQQAQLRSHVDLGGQWQWNASAYFVGRLPAQAVPSYTRLDTNVIWQPRKQFSISLVGQNLLRDHHLEFSGPDETEESSLIKRSAYLKFSWCF